MPDVERTVTVTTPIERVWDFMADFTNTETWDPPTQSTERTSGDGGVGTTYHNVSKLLGKETEVDYTVVRHEPPRLLELTGVAGSVETLDTITLEGTPEGGTRLTYRLEMKPHGAAKLATPIMPVAMDKLADSVAESLEKTLQAL